MGLAFGLVTHLAQFGQNLASHTDRGNDDYCVGYNFASTRPKAAICSRSNQFIQCNGNSSGIELRYLRPNGLVNDGCKLQRASIQSERHVQEFYLIILNQEIYQYPKRITKPSTWITVRNRRVG